MYFYRFCHTYLFCLPYCLLSQQLVRNENWNIHGCDSCFFMNMIWPAIILIDWQNNPKHFSGYYQLFLNIFLIVTVFWWGITLAFNNIGLIFGSIASFIFLIFWLKESKNKGRKFMIRYLFIFLGAIMIILTNFINIPQFFAYDLGDRNLLYIAYACLCLQLIVDICYVICAIFRKVKQVDLWI